jgi:hypothetical protein
VACEVVRRHAVVDERRHARAIGRAGHPRRPSVRGQAHARRGPRRALVRRLLRGSPARGQRRAEQGDSEKTALTHLAPILARALAVVTYPLAARMPRREFREAFGPRSRRRHRRLAADLYVFKPRRLAHDTGVSGPSELVGRAVMPATRRFDAAKSLSRTLLVSRRGRCGRSRTRGRSQVRRPARRSGVTRPSRSGNLRRNAAARNDWEISGAALGSNGSKPPALRRGCRIR